MMSMISLLILFLGASLVHGLYDSTSDIIELNPINFQSKVIGSSEIWVVEFYAPWCGHCQALVPEYVKLAKALKGIVKVGAVDASEHKSLGGQYGVQGFPTIKLFGNNKNAPIDYQGERKAESIASQAISLVRDAISERMGKKAKREGGSGSNDDSKDVVKLTDSNFEESVLKSNEMWLVEFFAPWCGHCKNLAPHWSKAATQLKGKVMVGAVDATVQKVLGSRFRIEGFPTIKFFGSGKKEWDSSEDYTEGSKDCAKLKGRHQYSHQITDKAKAVVLDKNMTVFVVFSVGGRTADSIVSWAMEKWEKQQPPPEVLQVTSQDVMDQCIQKQLCFVSFLPHILDSKADGRNAYLEIAKAIGEQYKQRSFGWVWLEGGVNPNLEQSLEVGGFGYPALVAVNGRKGAYSSLRGSYSKDGIKTFVRELIAMKSATISIRQGKLPDMIAVEPWDGKDGEMPTDEDDIDLSDVSLDDESQKGEL